MANNKNNNKQIAKNTVVLYVKLVISIIINFISARLVLQALGASDYGLYNVVGGIVAMLNILATAMISTSYRYMAVEIGKNEMGDPNRIYNSIFLVHIILALLLVLVGETIGVYYVNHYLNVDPFKIEDALFVLHMSLLATAFTVITIPTNGLIIAREKFVFTSVISIITELLKLIVVIALIYVTDDKLRLYAGLIAFVHIIPPIAYQFYCQINDKEVVRWKFNRCWDDYKSIIIFAWWIFIGAFASVAKTQGAAMIINGFFGTILNAAFGLATQIYNAATQFTTTIRQAAIPQIMKGQASGDEEHSLNLVYRVSRYSYLCMLIPAIPLIICIKGVLVIWLGTAPEYTDIFIVLMLLNGMIANLCAGFDATIQATGKIRKNQIGYCLISLSLLPIIYILYKIGMPPYVNIITMCILTFITLVFQCWIMTNISAFSVSKYIKITVVPSLLTTIVAFLPLALFYKLFNSSVAMTIVGAAIAVIWTVTTVFIAGMDKNEKGIIISFVNRKIFRKLS